MNFGHNHVFYAMDCPVCNTQIGGWETPDGKKNARPGEISNMVGVCTNCHLRVEIHLTKLPP